MICGIIAKPFRLLFKQLVVESEINLIIVLYVYVARVIKTFFKKSSLDLSKNQTITTPSRNFLIIIQKTINRKIKFRINNWTLFAIFQRKLERINISALVKPVIIVIEK